MKRVGITGQNGFVGTHLYNTLSLLPDEFETISFERDIFMDESAMDQWVKQCDVIVHLAAMNRHTDPQLIHDTNLSLVDRLLASLERTGHRPHIIFASSTQEERDSPYGKSKKEGRALIAGWAKKNGATITGLVIPNVYGPFGKPFYNSVVATFCHQLCREEQPVIDIDGHLKLIYVGELVEVIIETIREGRNQEKLEVAATAEQQVSGILAKLLLFKNEYLDKGIFPALYDTFDLHLFNTFRSYIDLSTYFARKLTQHTDERGTFVELARLGLPGQVSFSTTQQGITRGNHFHTRKIERFAVIRGKARIQLRRYNTEEVFNFDLDGAEPAYVDMPVWYTHNITNTGAENLFTVFWINEPYDPADPDTYFEKV